MDQTTSWQANNNNGADLYPQRELRTKTTVFVISLKLCQKKKNLNIHPSIF